MKLLTSVDRYAHYGLGFEGRIYKPGAAIAAAELGQAAVVLECAGPQGEFRRGKQRETLWILWVFRRDLGKWVELGRAPAINWEWAITLREPAWKALQTDHHGFYDAIERGATLAEKIMKLIDRELSQEHEDLRVNVLASVYQSVACRMAAG